MNAALVCFGIFGVMNCATQLSNAMVGVDDLALSSTIRVLDSSTVEIEVALSNFGIVDKTIYRSLHFGTTLKWISEKGSPILDIRLLNGRPVVLRNLFEGVGSGAVCFSVMRYKGVNTRLLIDCVKRGLVFEYSNDYVNLIAKNLGWDERGITSRIRCRPKFILNRSVPRELKSRQDAPPVLGGRRAS